MVLSSMVGSMLFSKKHSVTLTRTYMLGERQSSESCEVRGEAELGEHKRKCYFTNGFLTVLSP